MDPWWTYCPKCGSPTAQPRASAPQRMLLGVFHWLIPDLETGMIHQRHCVNCGSFEVVPPPFPGLSCQMCGYDLLGSVAESCPECGWDLPENLKHCRTRTNERPG